MRTALSTGLAVLALAGCGGGSGPTIAPTVATRLAAQASAVAASVRAGNACTARNHARTLQRETIAAINAGKVPSEFQETLQARVNELASELEPRCLPTTAPAPSSQQTVQQPSAPQPKAKPKPHGHEKPKDHGHGHGHGHGKGDE